MPGSTGAIRRPISKRADNSPPSLVNCAPAASRMTEWEAIFEALRGGHLVVGLPTFRGGCSTAHMMNMVDLATLCARYGVELTTQPIIGTSIQLARTLCAVEFLKSSANHLMFIDDDIGFDPIYVLQLMALARPDNDCDIVGGAYASRQMDWSAIRKGVARSGEDVACSQEPQFTGNAMFWPLRTDGVGKPVALDDVVEVAGIPGGFMMVTRKALERFAARFPSDVMKMREGLPGQPTVYPQFFSFEVDPAGTLFSEDYNFCRKVREAGGSVWLCPWMDLAHFGQFEFRGSFDALAQGRC